MLENVVVKVILDKRRVKKEGVYPLKLRVRYNNKTRYYSLGKDITEDDYKKSLGRTVRNRSRYYNNFIVKAEDKAFSVIEKMEDFDFDSFSALFRGVKKLNDDVYSCITNKIDTLMQQDRIKTANAYASLLSSLKTYYQKEKLSFSVVSISYLDAYENWILKTGKSITTVGIYLRHLRSIYNQAIEDGIVSRDKYPFGKRKYQIPSGTNTKKALPISEIRLIADYRAANTNYLFARDMWLFSYLTNGANMVDIFSLREANIQDGFIVFQRKKTLRTTRLRPLFIRVFISDRMQDIIDQWRPKNNSFLFPVLEEGMTEKDIIRKVDSAIRQINKYIGFISKDIGLSKHITTYTARHSFSTVLKRSGASIAFISESLGHKSMATTAYYLDSFEDDEKKKWSLKLL